MNFQRRDIIFDLGGVVLDWNPDVLIAASFSDLEIRRIVRHDIFDHPDWGDLDRGVIHYEVLIDRAAERTDLPRDRIASMFDRVTPSLVAVPETVDLLRRLKAMGHRLFCLSNMYPEAILHLESICDFWDVFTATVISCRVQAVKPDHEIYRHLLEGNRLTASETVFFDDLRPNIEAARSLGIRAYLFRTTEECESTLRRIGYL